MGPSAEAAATAVLLVGDGALRAPPLLAPGCVRAGSEGRLRFEAPLAAAPDADEGAREGAPVVPRI